MEITSSLIAMVLIVVLWIVYLIDRTRQAAKAGVLEDRLQHLESKLKDLKSRQESDNDKLTQLEIEVSNIR
ncbi:MAG: hypothetical protein P8X75_05750 [Limibacillus sp.]|jgi:hypothetical protein